MGQTLSVTFTPTDTTDYNAASDSVTINVDKATPTITWANPADITYGTRTRPPSSMRPLLDRGRRQRCRRGTFTYTPAAGTILTPARARRSRSPSRPTDTTDYSTASASVTIDVDKATPTITWANPADIIYGTALSATQLDATSSWTVAGVKGGVAGTFTYTPAAGTILHGRRGQTLSVAFTPSDTTDYTTASAAATLIVDITPTIAWPEPAGITFGTALTTQLDATRHRTRHLRLHPGPGHDPRCRHRPDALGHLYAPGSVDLTSTVATVTIDVAGHARAQRDRSRRPLRRQPDPGLHHRRGFRLRGRAAASLEGIAPTLTYTNSAGASLGSTPPTDVGNYDVVAFFPGNANYSAVHPCRSRSPSPGNATIGLASSVTSAVFGQSVTFVATVAATSSYAERHGHLLRRWPRWRRPTRRLRQRDADDLCLAVGSHSITATYSGDANFMGGQSRAAWRVGHTGRHPGSPVGSTGVQQE